MSKKILYVEDEMVFQRLYGDALETAGFEVTICNNGEEGIEVAKKHRFDLIILDLIMPFQGGMSVLDSLSGKKAKTVILSTLSGNTDKQDAINAGAIDFLEKQNTSPEKLVEFVTAHTGKNGKQK